MSNSYFQFKQFTIHHDRCAMKVGTDGVLLGAWAPVENCKRILDVGSGTGLIALQLAQRTDQAIIVGVEIDESAAQQATENIQQSPWADRVSIYCCDFQHYQSSSRFDLIVSNPPYFVDAVKCPDQQRNAARHVDGLNYESLFQHSRSLLAPEGQIAIIVPAELETHVMDAAGKNGFYRYRCMRIFSKNSKPCRRLLLAFGVDALHPYKEEKLCLTNEKGEKSEGYKALTCDFYLKM